MARSRRPPWALFWPLPQGPICAVRNLERDRLKSAIELLTCGNTAGTEGKGRIRKPPTPAQIHAVS